MDVISAGATRFIADLASRGIEATVEGPSVLYTVYAVAGHRVGQHVPTGVSISELSGWPAAPPHWIHFPVDLTFASTNSDTSDCLPAWQRHSRDLGAWKVDRPPILNWIAHVRGVASEAIS